MSSTLDTMCAPESMQARDIARMKAEVAEHRGHESAQRPARRRGRWPSCTASDLLIAWRNQASQLCLEADGVRAAVAPRYLVRARDDRARPCTALCLVSVGQR